MDPEPGYDVTHFYALQQELERLNVAAVEAGLLVRSNAGPAVETRGTPSDRAPPGSAQKGKAGARRLLKLLGPVAGEDSPSVPGTNFTEDGVVRLLAHLRKARSQRHRFLRRLLRYLVRPVAHGARTSAGISVERLQVVSRQLLEIKTLGWHRFQSIRAARRGGQAWPSRSERSATRRAPARPNEPAEAALEVH